MIGLGLNATKTPTVNTNIVRDALVLRHDYKDRPVEPVSTGAAYFDEGNDDYIAVGDIASLKPGDGSFSISCWVNVKSITETTTRWIVGKADGASVAAGNSEGYGLYLGNGGTLWSFFVSDGAQSAIAVAPNTFIAANQWQHLCATFNGSTLAEIYVDGVLANTSSVSAGASLGDIDVSDDFKIGKLTSASTTHNGYICNVGYWNAVLTQPQVKSIMLKNYAALSASEKTNLVSWWNLDSTVEDLGTAVYDNHGGALGEEIVSNGDFSNGSTGWSKSSETTLFVSNGQLDIQSSSPSGEYGYAFSTINFVSGKSYLINFDVISTDVTDHIRVGATNDLEGNPVNIFGSGDIGLGSHSLVYLATADHAYLGFGGRNDMTTLVIDNVSVKLVNGNTGTLA